MKLLIIPVHFGDLHHPVHDHEFFKNLKQITKRSNIFLDLNSFLHLFMPENMNKYIDHFIEDFTRVFTTKIDLEIFNYAGIDNNSRSEENRLNTDRFNEVVSQMSGKKQVAIIMNSVHIPGFLSLFSAIIGYAEKTDFKFFEVGEVGNTESFIFDTTDPKSVEHLRFHSHIDFFLTRDIYNLTPKVAMLARGVHEKIKQAGGQEEYLKQLAETIL